MWLIIIVLYIIISFIDIKSFCSSQEKGRLILYLALMIISCIIGLTNSYLPGVPSPSWPIRNLVEAVVGS